jgi:hypothetical protein
VEKKTEKEIETMNDRPYPAADDAIAFPTLADSELAVLEALGTRQPVAAGEYLFREGDAAYDFYVILSGVVEVVVHSDGDEERIINRQGLGRFLGELNLLTGDRTLTSVRVTTGDVDAVLPCAALFSFIGADPAADWLSGCAALDEHDFVLTDRSLGEEHLDERWVALGRRPLPFETSYPGLFAVGDVRAGSTKRVAAAVGEGSAAVRSIHEYLAFAH